MNIRPGAASFVALSLALLPAATKAADPIIRHNVPSFPIASSVEVPPGYSTVYVSGIGAEIADKSAKPMTLAAYGNTETQTLSALNRIKGVLAGLHLGMADVVQMHVYMAADPALGHMDFKGLMAAYTKFFGTAAQPNLPTRAAFQVAALANPGWLVEIEVVAARKL